VVTRGRKLTKKEQKANWINHPFSEAKREGEMIMKKYTWICDGCGKKYLYRGSAEECENKHDKEAHPEKYVDERVYAKYESDWRVGFCLIQRTIDKDGDDRHLGPHRGFGRYSKILSGQEQMVQAEKKLIEVYNLLGIDPDIKFHEMYMECVDSLRIHDRITKIVGLKVVE